MAGILVSLMKFAILVFIGLLILVAPHPAVAQIGSDNHTVTVRVSEITLLQISSGSVNLTISGANAVAGVDMMSTTDQSSSLSWGTNASLKKVTVQSSLAAPVFTLKLLAVNPPQGLAAAEATLTSVAQDLLLNIGRSSGSCSLRYTGIAYASQGTGSETHSITLTIQAQ
jgi:hypothetical protein